MELFGMEFTPAQLFLAALEVVAIVLLIAVLFRKERTGETAAESPVAPVRTAGAAGEEEDEGEDDGDEDDSDEDDSDDDE